MHHERCRSKRNKLNKVNFKKQLTIAEQEEYIKQNFNFDRYDSDSCDEGEPRSKRRQRSSFREGLHFNMPFLFESEHEEFLRKFREKIFNGINSEERSNQIPMFGWFYKRWLRDYLGYELGPWKRITSTRDKIELEPIQCDWIPQLKPYKPILIQVHQEDGRSITVQRVGGYREILRKRSQMKFLEWAEAEDRMRRKFGTLSSVTEVKVVRKRSKVKREPAKIKKNNGKTVHFTKTNKVAPLLLPKLPSAHLIEQAPTTELLASTENASPLLPSTSSDSVLTDISATSSANSINDMNWSLIQAFQFHHPFHNCIPVGGMDPSTTASGDTSVTDKSTAASTEPDAATPTPSTKATSSVPSKDPKTSSKKAKSNRSVSLSVPSSAPSTKTRRRSSINKHLNAGRASVVSATDKSLAGSEYGDSSDSDDSDQSNKEEEQVQAEEGNDEEKDNEWLKLSSSDSDEIFFQYVTMNKEKPKWMKKRISYETQKFRRKINGFTWLSALLCRLPFFTRNDFDTELVMFNSGGIRIFPFLISSIAIWIIMVFSLEGIRDLHGGEDADLRDLDQLEFKKFRVFFFGIFVHLSFTGFWSMTTLLRDSYKVSQFMNYLNATITTVGVSGTRHLRRIFFMNMFITFVYCVIITSSFLFDFPKLTRGGYGFFALLFLRPFKHRIRIDYEDYKDLINVCGLVVHLFCYVSTRLIFTHMHLIAVTIGNLAEYWNFRFGLLFAQLGTEDPSSMKHGHIYRLHMEESLSKIFSHHRLISALVHSYGTAFAFPIIMYYLLQIIVVSSLTTILFFDVYSTGEIGPPVSIPGVNGSAVYESAKRDSILTSSFVLFHFVFEFVLVSEMIATACSAVNFGFEFIRRQGLIRCNNSHERRLLMSLEWSVSAKNPAMINVNDFFYVSRPGILASIGFSILIVSLVIQLKQTVLVTLVLPCVNPYNADPRNAPFCHEVLRVPQDNYESFQKINADKMLACSTTGVC